MRDKPCTVSCRLSRHEYALLTELCRRNGMTVNDALRIGLMPMLLAASWKHNDEEETRLHEGNDALKEAHGT